MGKYLRFLKSTFYTRNANSDKPQTIGAKGQHNLYLCKIPLMESFHQTGPVCTTDQPLRQSHRKINNALFFFSYNSRAH